MPSSSNRSRLLFVLSSATLVTLALTPGCGKKDEKTAAQSDVETSAPSLSFLSGNAAVEDLAFGDVALGKTKAVTLTVKNAGSGVAEGFGATLSIGVFAFSGGKYPGTKGTCSKSLAAGESCTVVIEYVPTDGLFEAKSDSSKLLWSWDLAGGRTTTKVIALTGRGGRCVTTKAGVDQGTHAQWSTFEAASNSDATAQSFVSSFTGESDGVSLALSKIQDAAQQALALEKVTVRLTADCPNENSGIGYPCEEVLAEKDILPADIPEGTSSAAETEKTKIRFDAPVSLESGKTYWIVVSTVGHTAGYFRVARNTVTPDAYASGLQIIGTFPDGYSRFDAWDLGFKVDQCDAFGSAK
jgi:hypothetical protein